MVQKSQAGRSVRVRCAGAPEPTGDERPEAGDPSPETVRLDDSARALEFVNQSWIGGHGARCTEVGQFRVATIPAEVSGDAPLSVLEVKAMNAGRRAEATHLLRWPSRDFPCDKNGTPNEASERVCSEQEVTAYQCVIGRGS